jgi:hypothetical protein
MKRRAAIVLGVLCLLPIAHAAADDSGPRPDVGDVRASVHTLLVHRARPLDPNTIAVSDVVVAGDHAVASWRYGQNHGIMGLVRTNDRWWDALEQVQTSAQCWSSSRFYPLSSEPVRAPAAPSSGALSALGFPEPLVAAAAQHNADVQAANALSIPPGAKIACRPATQVNDPPNIDPRGGMYAVSRTGTAGYDLRFTYAGNDARNARFSLLYGRAPTHAEILAYPVPQIPGPNAVFFFDLAVASTTPVAFQRGSAIDVWFPFVLAPDLRYELTIDFIDPPMQLVRGSLYDNVLHFDLPAFTVKPGKTAMAQIDGD